MALTVRLIHGDCLEHLNGISPGEIVAVVTDPPYGLVMHRAKWDVPWLEPDEGIPSDEVESFDPERFQAWSESWLRLCYDKLPPGGVIKVFSATRTYHRLIAAMTGVGFAGIGFEAWLRGRTLPRGMDIGKFFERQACGDPQQGEKSKLERAAGDWAGWNTALKTSWEPVLVGQKP